MAPPKYQRLTRDKTPFRFALASVARSSLWLGEDHLLLAACAGVTETYKRFYFRDIQAITLRQTNGRTVVNWVAGAPATGCFLIALLSFQDHGLDNVMVIVFSLLFVFFTIPFILNNLWGPTCTCQIRTAVQAEDLPSLCRLRQTRKALAKVLPLIAAAQGRLTAEDAAQHMETLLSAAHPPAATSQPLAGAGQEVPPPATA